MKNLDTLKQFIQEQRKKSEGYPKIIEISKGAKPFKIDKSWDFDVPINSLTKNYENTII